MSGEFGIDLDRVRRFLRSKDETRRRDLEERLHSAREDFERIVAAIIERYDPLRIYQWGSLLHQERFSEISDIDIALEGVNGPEEYFAILGLASELTSFPVDIIELDRLDPATSESIRCNGRLVYERHENS